MAYFINKLLYLSSAENCWQLIIPYAPSTLAGLPGGGATIGIRMALGASRGATVLRPAII